MCLKCSTFAADFETKNQNKMKKFDAQRGQSARMNGTQTGETLRSIFCVLLMAVCLPLGAQNSDTTSVSSEADTMRHEVVALKNNLLYDAILTPNLQLEFRLTDKWTLELGAGFNPFPLNDEKFPKWRHVSATIQPKYWFCHAFNRDFIAFNVSYAHFNVAGSAYPIGWMYPSVKTNRYQGDAAMIGLSYGWHFAISPHFSIELEIGAEGGYAWFDQFECQHCGKKTDTGGGWFGLPKAGISLVVPLGGDKASLARRCDCEKEQPVDTLVPEPVDTLMREPIDTIIPQPIDTIVPEPIDTIVPEPIDTIVPVIVDTIVPEPIDTIVPEPVDTVIPEPAPRYEAESREIKRLRNRLLRREDEYIPYTTDMALSADERNVFLFFEVNVTKMDRSFLSNDRLMDSIMFVLGEALKDTTLRITRIQIVGYASFDGRRAYNSQLAAGRANTIKEYVQSNFGLSDSIFSVCNGEEGWTELKYRLQQVEFEGRDEVIAIIDSEPDPDVREAKIKQLHGGATYRYMRDQLRTIMRNLGCITIYYEEIER